MNIIIIIVCIALALLACGAPTSSEPQSKPEPETIVRPLSDQEYEALLERMTPEEIAEYIEVRKQRGRARPHAP